MADQNTRRIGCGCLPLVVLLVLGSFVLRAFEGVTGIEIDSGLVVGIIVAMVAVFLVTGASQRRRQREAEDRTGDGIPTSTAPSGSPIPPLPTAPPSPVRTRPAAPPTQRQAPAPSPPGASVGSGSIEPEAEVLRRRLADAVADISAEVDQVDAGGRLRGLTSEEMIARAKRRIAEMRDD
jgi:hypothetical protein